MLNCTYVQYSTRLMSMADVGSNAINVRGHASEQSLKEQNCSTKTDIVWCIAISHS